MNQTEKDIVLFQALREILSDQPLTHRSESVLRLINKCIDEMSEENNG